MDAPPRAVAGLLRDAEFLVPALARAGHVFRAPVRLLRPGSEVRLAVRVAPGVQVPVRTVVRTASADGTTSVLRRGPLRALAHDTLVAAEGNGALVTDEVRWRAPLGPLADAVLVRRLVTALLAARAAALVEAVPALRSRRVVVGTALHRDGTLLVAQRTRPPALAGRWELPGGRVEDGESEEEAVVRECREELGTDVRVTGRLGTDLPLDGPLVLRVHAAELAPGAPEPRALEHAALRWVRAEELDAVEWVEADRAVVAELRELLVGARAER